MYKPINSLTLKESSEPQIRLGLQGYGGTGKTYAALTFPNPVVLDLDRGLGAHHGRTDVIQLRCWDLDWWKSISTITKVPQPNVADIKNYILLWLNSEGMKLEQDQTLVIDGGTGLQNAYHKWYSANPSYSSKTGKENEFAEWMLKINFFGDVCEILKRLKCHVVYLSHETDKKDKNGEYTGKIRPLLTGQFGDQLMTHFTDWFRTHCGTKPIGDKLKQTKPETLTQWGCKNLSEFENMLEMFFPGIDTVYYWQTFGDDQFDGKVSSLVNFPKYIPASYIAFRKYMKISSVSQSV